MLLDLVTPLHEQTKRDYMARLMDDKVACMKRAREFERDYWDGDRRYGYGGYRDDGRWEAIAQRLIERYELNPGMRILDIGCGKGFLLNELQKQIPELYLYGIERSLYALNNMPAGLRGAFHYGKVEEPGYTPTLGEHPLLPYPDQSMDLIISLGCLHNLTLSQLWRVLPEIARVGRQGYIMVESFRNEAEWFNLCAWCLTAESLMRPEDWCFLYDKCGYKGDYEFIYFN